MKTYILILFALTMSFFTDAQQIKESEVPANVKAVASKQTNSQPVTMWVLDKKRGKYIASVINTTTFKGIEISLDGKWIETMEGLQAASLPAPVIKAATDGFPSFELSNFSYITSPGNPPYYAIDASSDEEDLRLFIDPNGNVLEKKQR
jgi:hypothetical protein